MEIPMGQRGTLTKANLGFSMPARAPLYPAPPFYYKDARMLAFPYLTDAKAAAAFLPNTLELPDVPTAGLVFASYPWSTLGPYEEVVQYIDCLDNGVPKQFATALFVTSDAAMASGREAAGFPKKIATIQVTHETAYVASIERPHGLLLASATIRPDQPNPQFTVPRRSHYLTLRIIPSPIAGAPPSLCELVETEWVFTSGEMWSATGSFRYTGNSILDPLDQIPVVTAGPCFYLQGDLQVAPTPAGGIRPF
jgi:acetoacetate decarboxylase